MAPSLALPSSLPSVPSPEREAISDATLRAVLGIDTNDIALFDSALTKDAVFEMNGYAQTGLDAIHAGVFANVGPMDTTHFITNQRVVLHADGKTATMTASALAQHYPPGKGAEGNGPHLLAGSLYGVDLVKEEDGMWRIKYWNMRVVWKEGDEKVMSGER